MDQSTVENNTENQNSSEPEVAENEVMSTENDLDLNLFGEEKASLRNRIAQSRKRLITAGGIFLLLIIAGTGYQFGWYSTAEKTAAAPSGPPPAVVALAEVRSMTMAPHTVLPGTVVSVRDAVIASETSGKIISVANVGDVVAVGDSIAEIDARDATQLVEQRQAELARLKSLLTYHNDYYERIGVADNKLGVSEIGIAELKSNRDTAKADVARAESALRSAENALKRTSISAPFPGSVVSQSIQPGEYAQVGSPVIRLVDTANLEVSTRVPAALVQPIQPGTLLEVTGMGKTLTAPLRALVPVGDEVSRTMELRVELKDTGLLVGSPVRVSLPSAEPKQVVAIPRDAVILRSDSQYVFVVKEGKAHRKSVELGYAEGDMIEVLGDVSPNDMVVIRGGERLRDSQMVSWKEQSDAGAGVVSSAP